MSVTLNFTARQHGQPSTGPFFDYPTCGEGPGFGVMCLTVLVCAHTGAMADTSLERVEYLVNGIMACGVCHTPRGPDGAFDMAKQLSGGPQTWDRPAFTVKGANLTPDRETGVGTWTDAEIKRALTEGARPNEVPLAPIMPSALYK